MKKLCVLFVICFAMAAVTVFAHHPAADIVDSEIYEAIDEMVSQTPHDTIIEEMMTTTEEMKTTDIGIIKTKIITNSIGAAESLINRGIISFTSELSGKTTITIEYVKDTTGTESYFQNSSLLEKSEKSLWWRTPVIITITQIKDE